MRTQKLASILLILISIERVTGNDARSEVIEKDGNILQEYLAEIFQQLNKFLPPLTVCPCLSLSASSFSRRRCSRRAFLRCCSAARAIASSAGVGRRDAIRSVAEVRSAVEARPVTRAVPDAASSAFLFSAQLKQTRPHTRPVRSFSLLL